MDRKIAIFVFILCIFLFVRIFIFYEGKTEYKDGSFLQFSSRLSGEPKAYGSYQSFTLETKEGDRIFIKTSPDFSFNYGDNLNVSGNIKIQLLKNGRLLEMDFPKISFVKNKTPEYLAVALSIRQKIIEIFQKNLPSDSSSLMLGIVFGIKENMSYDFSQKLKTAGVMHVIAASGMNITMVGGFIFYLFSQFLKRQFAIIISIIVIFFYAFLAGFEASIIRASIMGIIAFSAQGLGRQNYGFYALLLTGFIMLFSFPKYIFDIGFQLSFLSTLGILFIPKFFGKLENLVSGDFLTTISAQVSTFPVILSNFGTYSLWSVLVNVLVLWTIPILMILGALAAFTGFIFEPFSKIFLYLCIPILAYFEQVVDYFGRGVSINVNIVPWQFIFSYYLFLLSIASLVLRRKRLGKS